jgi:ribose transport system substrate-binding protein
VASVIALAGCSSGDPATDSASPVAGKTKTIKSIGLMVQDTSNPFFAAMAKGAKEAGAKLGAKVNVQDAQLDLSTQNNQIDAFIQQGTDVIVISAVDQEGIGPAIERAKAAGIIVVAVDTPASGAQAVVETNAVQAGEVSCTYLFEQMGGQGDVLLVDGTPIQTIIDRIKGCKNVAKKFPGIKIVGQQASKNDRASGQAVTVDMLTAHPGVTGIFGMNDPSALGAVLAVQQDKLASKVKVSGVDGSPQAVDELKAAGSPYIASATQSPAEMVRQAVAIAAVIASGKTPAEAHVLIPSVLVTRDNVSEYPGW